MATDKSARRMFDAAVNDVCALNHHLLLPRGNLFPPSYHIIKAILDVPAASTYERHLCTGCWRVFPWLPSAKWHAQHDDTCAACGTRRFNIGLGGQVTARRLDWHFGVEDTMRSVLSVPGILARVAETRADDFERPWTFWGSPAGRALDCACNCKFSNPAEGEIAMAWSFGAHL